MGVNPDFPNISPGGTVLVPVYEDTFGNISSETVLPNGGTAAVSLALVAEMALDAVQSTEPISGQIIAANASAFPTVAAFLANATSAQLADQDFFYIPAYQRDNDGGGGFFVWEAASTSPHDGVINFVTDFLQTSIANEALSKTTVSTGASTYVYGNVSLTKYSGTLAHGNLIPGTVQFNCNGTVITDNYNGQFLGQNTFGTINYLTGAWVVYFVTAPGGGFAFTASYTYANAPGRAVRQFNGKPSILFAGADATGTYDSSVAVQQLVYLGVPACAPTGTFLMNNLVYVAAGQNFDLECADQFTEFVNGNAAGYINAFYNPSADNSYPHAFYPGPMSGSCFYFNNNSLSIDLKGGYFQGFKFALAILNSPYRFRANFCTFYQCNAFAFWYLSSQQPFYKDIVPLAPCGPVHISSSTCYPLASPYAGADNDGTDWPIFESRFATLGGATAANSYFDVWFTVSILQVSVGSYTASGSNITLPYASTDVKCTPSGWALFFCAVRNLRATSGIGMINIKVQSGGCFGVGLWNGLINSGFLVGYIWEYETFPGAQHFIFGAAQYFSVSGLSTLPAGSTQVPFINFTGQNAANSKQYDGSYVLFSNAGVTPLISTAAVTAKTLGQVNGVSNMLGHSNAAPANPVSGWTSFQAAATGAIIVPFDESNLSSFPGLGNSDSRYINAFDQSIILPMPCSDGNYRTCIALYVYDSDVTGLLKVSVLNPVTGQTDYGEFYIQTCGNNASQTLTTSAALNNGDSYIYVTSVPTNMANVSPFAIWSVGGVDVAIDSYDSVNERLNIHGYMSGLSGTVAAGASAVKNHICNAVTPFTTGMASVGFSKIPGSANILGIINNVATPGGSLTGDLLIFQIQFENNKFGAIQNAVATPPVAVTTVGAATLTAAQIFTGLIYRGGTQTAAFTDTTDTAANLLAALPGSRANGGRFRLRYLNQGATYTATLAGGTGVTAGAVGTETFTVAPGTWREFEFQVTNSLTPTFTFYDVGGGNIN